MSRTWLASGPITRNCTGKPTGGPKLKRSTRTRASLSAPSATAFSIFALIDDELQIGRLLVPVELDFLDIAVLPDHVAHLVGDVAHLVGVGTNHAELHGKADRRTEIETVDADAGFAQRAIGHRILDLRLD